MAGPAEEGLVAGTAGPAARQRLYLHVGLPKSGSTYLQAVLGNNRQALREHGHVYPYVRQEGMFFAAVEMIGSADRWGLDPDEIGGTFAHLLRRGRRLGGSVVISHEIFGSASRDQAEVMGAMLTDFEVHLVVTVRDLGRTATAEWQEQVKNGNPRSFARYAEALVEHVPTDPVGDHSFWRSQNLMRVLDSWHPVVEPGRIHVVTCPRSGAPPDLLWRRFAEAIELSPEVVDLSRVPVRNESLGTAQIAFLRQVEIALDHRLEQPWHSRLAKRWFAQTLLSQGRSPKPVTPATVTERLTPVSQHWVDQLVRGGYRIHGDPAELLPEVADPDAPHPDDVQDAEMLDALPQAAAAMLLRARDLNVALEEATARAEEAERERDRLAAELAALTALRRFRWFPRRTGRPTD